VIPLVPHHRVAIQFNGTAADAFHHLRSLLQGSGPLDGILGAASSNTHRITGRVEDETFKLAVQPPRLWRIPYLPVLMGHVEGSSVVITARPPIYELLFLPLWAAFVLFDGGPLWFGLGAPLAYHCIGWCVFSAETKRIISVLNGALETEARASNFLS
jgi:hypothetical protein